MKWLVLPALWIAAAVVTIAVLWRMWRGKPVVLKGKISPRIIRMVVILLIAMGIGVEKTQAERPPFRDRTSQPVGTTETLPVTKDQITLWVTNHIRSAYGRYTTTFAQLKKNIAIIEQTGKLPPGLTEQKAIPLRVLPKAFDTIVRDDVSQMLEGKPPVKVTAAQLQQALVELQSRGMFDSWVAGFLWRKTQHIPAGKEAELVKFLTNLQRYVRVTNVLIRAQGMTKPIFISPRAWMSKAGPSRQIRQLQLTTTLEIIANVKKLYAKETTGTWERDGVVQLTVAKNSGPVTLIRGGKEIALKPGEKIRFGRLDALVTPAGGKAATLSQSWLGEISIPAGTTATIWKLPGLLSADGKKKAKSLVEQAVAGKELPGIQVERSLPLSYELLRAELARNPKAEGAPRLRLILSLFDDATLLSPKPKPAPVIKRRGLEEVRSSRRR